MTVTTALESISDSHINTEAVESLTSVVVAATPANHGSGESVSSPDTSTGLAHAVTLQAQATSQAALEEAAQLREQLAEAHTLLSVQRANAEQARRVAECLRGFHDMLLEHLAQPCFALDQDGNVTGWTPRMAHWSGLAAEEVEGKPLSERVCAAVRGQLDRARRAAFRRRAADRYPSQPLTLPGPLTFLPDREVNRITLLPLCRIPGTMEALVVLLEI